MCTPCRPESSRKRGRRGCSSAHRMRASRSNASSARRRRLHERQLLERDLRAGGILGDIHAPVLVLHADLEDAELADSHRGAAVVAAIGRHRAIAADACRLRGQLAHALFDAGLVLEARRARVARLDVSLDLLRATHRDVPSRVERELVDLDVAHRFFLLECRPDRVPDVAQGSGERAGSRGRRARRSRRAAFPGWRRSRQTHAALVEHAAIAVRIVFSCGSVHSGSSPGTACSRIALGPSAAPGDARVRRHAAHRSRGTAPA